MYYSSSTHHFTIIFIIVLFTLRPFFSGKCTIHSAPIILPLTCSICSTPIFFFHWEDVLFLQFLWFSFLIFSFCYTFITLSQSCTICFTPLFFSLDKCTILTKPMIFISNFANLYFLFNTPFSFYKCIIHIKPMIFFHCKREIAKERLQKKCWQSVPKLPLITKLP